MPGKGQQFGISVILPDNKRKVIIKEGIISYIPDHFLSPHAEKKIKNV
jgi:hypothetical protein